MTDFRAAVNDSRAGENVIPPATEQRIVDMAHWGRFLIDHGVLTETEVVTAQLLEIRDLAAGRMGGEAP